MRSPKFNGDALTQAVGHVAQLEWEWTRDWTAELVRFLLADEREGPHNSEVVERWIREWEPRPERPPRARTGLRRAAGGHCLRRRAGQRRDRRRRAARRRRRRRAGEGRSMSEGAYDYVGIVMAKSAEGDAVADALQHPDVTVIEQPSFWEIKAKDRLVIDFDEVSEELGFEIDGYAIQHEMSTHYGRLIATDDALLLVSDPLEAMEHLSG